MVVLIVMNLTAELRHCKLKGYGFELQCLQGFFATKFLLKLLTAPLPSFINIYSCSKCIFVSAQCTPVVHVRYAPEPNNQKEPEVNPIFFK